MMNRKTSLLLPTLMVLGAACLVLLIGGFPLWGEPSVYRSGLMLGLGISAGLLSLWGGWRLAVGQRARFVCGLVSTFFACAGVVVFWQYGGKALQYTTMGGLMWLGALGMACTAMVGLLFTSIFGYFAYRFMTRRLWLAGVHWSLFVLALGAYLDYCGEVRAFAQLPSHGRTSVCEVMTAEGEKVQLPFTLRVDAFHASYYGDDSYSLYLRQGEGWELLGHPEVVVDCLKYGEEMWALENLQSAPGMPQPFMLLPGSDEQPDRLLMRNARPVKDYAATCHIETEHRGRNEVRDEVVRVNAPLQCKGWYIYLNSYSTMSSSTLVTLQLRRAPGRFPALAGMVGVILCTACWCWWRREEESETVEASFQV